MAVGDRSKQTTLSDALMERVSNVVDRQIDVLERQQDALFAYDATDWRLLDRGYALADAECEHGHMAHDRKQVCTCFA